MKKIILILALLLVGCSSVTKLNVDTVFKDLEEVEIDDLNITSSHLQEYYYDENKYSFYLDMGNEEIDKKVEQVLQLYDNVAIQLKQGMLDLEFKVVDKINSDPGNWLMNVSFNKEDTEYRFNFYAGGGIKVEKITGNEIEHAYIQADELETATFVIDIDDLWDEYHREHMELYEYSLTLNN